MKIWNKFYCCDCATEGIVTSFEYLEKDEENLPSPLIDLYFWTIQNKCKNTKMSFKQRLQGCWKILTTGTCYSDMVMLDKKTAIELGNDLVTWGLTSTEKGG